jgi:hypothetical protein
MISNIGKECLEWIVLINKKQKYLQIFRKINQLIKIVVIFIKIIVK